MSTPKNGVHILIIPYPAQGHMLPLLDLTHHLSLHAFSITLLVTPKNLPIITPLLSSHPSIQTLILPFPSHPSLPPGVENVKDIGNHGNIPIMSALSHLQDPIIHWFNSHPNPPVALLSDFFLPWTHTLATRIGIPRIVFYSSGAFLTAVFHSLWLDHDEVNPGPGSEVIRFDDLPRMPGFTWHQLPSLYRRYRGLKSSDDGYQVISTLMAGNSISWGTVINTCGEVEDEFLDYLVGKFGHQRVYAVGPLNVVGSLRVNDEMSEQKDKVISWLDQWGHEGDDSVLYVCFGSQKLLKKPQMEALAVGLEQSGVRFIWAFKTPTPQQAVDGYGSVPDGFTGRVSGRGLIIEGWAPQTAILSHRAVGGFLSHCGWNSVLEAMVCGVMILGWPMEADQFVNAKLMVEYKEAAVVVCEGGDTVPDSNQLARKINEAMKGDVAERVKAEELKTKVMEAIEGGGKSDKDLVRLVQDIVQLKA